MPNETEPAVEEVETTTVEETPTTSVETTSTASTRLHPDDIAAISDNVFGRIQRFAQDLVTAGQQAEEIAGQMLPPVEAPTPDQAPTPEEAPPPDQGPQRRHGIFGQPFKRREN